MGYVEMSKIQRRQSIIPKPEYAEPCNFYHTIDVCRSKDDFKPKTVKPPSFEVLGNRRRTDTSFVKMR